MKILSKAMKGKQILIGFMRVIQRSKMILKLFNLTW